MKENSSTGIYFILIKNWNFILIFSFCHGPVKIFWMGTLNSQSYQNIIVINILTIIMYMRKVKVT